MPEVPADFLLVVDGVRQPLSRLSAFTVYDIAEIRLLHDPEELIKWGTRHQSVLLVTTRLPRQGTVNVTYRFDGGLQSAANGDAIATPVQTGFGQHHQLDVEGRDSTVGYLFSAYGVPTSHGVVKGTSCGNLGLRTYISYSRRTLRLSNDLSFRHQDTEQSQEVRYLQSLSDGSFLKSKSALLTDHLAASLDLSCGLHIGGDFSFSYERQVDDCFLSPRSGWFTAVDDARTRGSYHKDNQTELCYESSLQADYSHQTADHLLTLNGGLRLYAGEQRGDSYGGLGVLSDRMAYISFTLGYDTTAARVASERYERTLSTWATVGYQYRQRYGLSAGATVWHSSLLAPQHRTALHSYARLLWHLHRESWLSDPRWRQLTLSLTYSQTGFVPFGYEDFTTLYQNRTSEQYIYNYYLTGSRLVHLADEELKPARTTTTQFAVNAQWQQTAGQIRLYHQQTEHTPLPDVNGVDLNLSAPLVSGSKFRLTVNGGLRYDHFSAEEAAGLPTQDSRHLTTAHLALNAFKGAWSAHLSASGDKDMGRSALQLNYRFASLPRPLKSISIGAAVVNPVCWQPDDVWQVRRYLLSLNIEL